MLKNHVIENCSCHPSGNVEHNALANLIYIFCKMYLG